MRATIQHHGHLLARVALAAAIAAVAAPFIATFAMTPYLFGDVPYPPVNPMLVVLMVSAIFAIVGLAVGMAVWTVRAPGYQLGMAAVLTIGVSIVFVGGILATGYLMSLSHMQMRA